jgi:DNA replication protein DnaC
MAAAIIVEACNKGKKVRFYRISTLVNELNDAQLVDFVF